MTQPLASASTNVYTVTFDGFEVAVHAAKRGKLLHRVPVAQLLAVEFKPARGMAGGSLRLRTAGKTSPRDTIYFMGGQEADMAHLAATIQRYCRPPQSPWPDQMPAAQDPWPPMEQPTTVRVVPDPGVARSLSRALTWAVRLELASLVLLLVPCVVGLAVAIWLITR